MIRRSVLFAILALLLPMTAVFAQVNATVAGTVSDATGALIPGVEVNATNVNTGIVASSVTNETGSYNFASLQPGTYKVSASLASFKTQTYENVLLSQGQQVRLNFTLEVAAVGDTVEVTTNADATLATTSASVGDVLPVQEVQSLPLAVRDVLGLISATAGVSGGRNFGGQGSRALNMTRDGLVVNDSRYGTGSSTSGQNGTFVSSDLVEEVQVVVGNVDAESGRGSGQVSLQTRSGTNQIHGAAFYFNNNSALNSNSYFQNVTNQKKTYTNRNQYGGRLGGPIVKNKAFFFFLIDNQRYLQKQNFVATVLTPTARQGIFRYIAGRQNGNAQQASASVDLNGNPIAPVTSFNLFSDVQDPFRTGISTDAYWRYVLAQMPLPNDYTVGDGLNTAGFRWLRPIEGLGGGNSVGNENNRDQLNVRLDYQVNGSNKVTFTTSREEDRGVTTNLLSDWPGGFNGTNQYFPHLYTLGVTSTITPTVLNEFRYGTKVTSYHRRAPFQLGCCFDNDASSWTDRTETAKKALDLLPKSGNYIIFPIASAYTFGSGTGDANLLKHGFDLTRGQKSPTIQFSDNLSFTQGHHSLKTGFELIRNWSNGWNTTSEQVPTAIFGNGNFPVTNITATRFPGLNSTDATNAVSLLNDLAASIGGLTFGRVLNSPTQTSWDDFAGDPRRFRHLTQLDWAMFFKDTWNVSQNLTLNFGVRYDKFGVLFDQKGMIARAKGGEKSLYNYATNGTLTESQFVGKGSPNSSELFWPNDWNNIGPSIGFSYKAPWFGKTTVLRGGYGINYAGASVILDYENDFGNAPGSADVYLPATPFVPTSYTSLASAVATKAVPLPAKTQPGIIVIPVSDKTQVMNTPTDNHATPYIQSFNFSVQRELGAGVNLELAYVGSKGTRLFEKYSINEPNLAAAANGETMLQAFNITRAGGNSALFNRLLNGLTVPGVTGTVGTNLTGSEAFRRWSSTRVFLANGSVGQFADFVSKTSAITGVSGGLLSRAGLPQSFITMSPQFSDAQIWGTGKNSTYNSLQVQLTKQYKSGFTGQMAYTWSKGLGDGVAGETGATTLDPNNRRANKSRQGFDHTHVVNTHGTWELPIGTGKALAGSAPKWVDRIIGGWQLSGIGTFNSGDPLNITSTVRTTGSISNLSVPNIAGAFDKSLGTITKDPNRFVQYFPGMSSVLAPTAGLYGADPDRVAQFSTLRNIVDGSGNILLTNPQAGSVGNLGARWIEGPGAAQIDLSMAKKIQLLEGTTFTLRVDAINALNLTPWGNPNTNINDVNFGRITGLATGTSMRQFTLSGRVDF